MSVWQALAIVLAGVAAGTINTIVGSGSLITFPTLLAVGYPPVLANVSNCIGLVPGGVSGVVGYRRELAGQRTRLLRMGIASALVVKIPRAIAKKVVLIKSRLPLFGITALSRPDQTTAVDLCDQPEVRKIS